MAPVRLSARAVPGDAGWEARLRVDFAKEAERAATRRLNRALAGLGPEPGPSTTGVDGPRGTRAPRTAETP